ncbi:MAG: hypothetical protein ACYTGL_29860 [Planctomycetota bacterium]|jgi:hypothetical protein
MVRRTFRFLKPLGIALLILALAPCVAEFVLRVVSCRRELTTDRDDNRVALVRSWHTFHELEPLQRTTVRVADSDPVEFRTNSLGLRGDEIADPKPLGVFRVVCLGDETILAPEIAENEVLSRILEAELQERSRVRVEVVNAGVPGYCPLLSYLQFRHRLTGLEPDLVVAHFDPTDVWDDRRFRRLTDLGPGERPLVCSHPDLLTDPVMKPLSESFLTLRLGERLLADWLSSDSGSGPSRSDNPRSRYAWLADDSGDWALQVGLALSACEHLADFCRDADIRLLLATHPAPWQVSTTASRGARIPEKNGIYPGTLFERSEPLQRIHEFARSRKLILCDVTGSFRNASSPDLLFQEDSHGFSPLGHRLYADQLAAAILLSVDGPWKSDTINDPAMLPAGFEQGEPPPQGGLRNTARPARANHPASVSPASRGGLTPLLLPPSDLPATGLAPQNAPRYSPRR